VRPFSLLFSLHIYQSQAFPLGLFSHSTPVWCSANNLLPGHIGIIGVLAFMWGAHIISHFGISLGAEYDVLLSSRGSLVAFMRCLFRLVARSKEMHFAMSSDHETNTSLVCLSSPIISSRVLSQAHYCFLTYYSPYRNREIAPQKSLSLTVLNASA
jgi:hypothetical protein